MNRSFSQIGAANLTPRDRFFESAGEGLTYRTKREHYGLKVKGAMAVNEDQLIEAVRERAARPELELRL